MKKKKKKKKERGKKRRKKKKKFPSNFFQGIEGDRSVNEERGYDTFVRATGHSDWKILQIFRVFFQPVDENAFDSLNTLLFSR